jgi:hypothetical protein
VEFLNDLATILGVVRDVVLLLLLVVALVGVLIIFRKAVSLINTVKRISDQAEQMVDTLSRGVVRPAASNPRLVRAAAGAVRFLTGLLTNRRRSGGRNDG